MQYFAFRWLSLLLSQVAPKLQKNNWNKIFLFSAGVSPSWRAQPLGRPTHWPNQVDLNIQEYHKLGENKTRYSLSSGVICSYKLVQRWSSWWVNLISSRRKTKTSNCSQNTFGNWILRYGTTSAQMTSLPTWKCYRWIKHLGIFNIAQKVLIWISSRLFWCVLQNYPPIDVRLIIEKARQLSST